MAKGVRYEQHVHELAFRVWRSCGQNWTQTQRALANSHGLTKLTRDRLYEWAAADNWQDRAARLKAEEERAEFAKLLGRESILVDLNRQKRNYEAYFECLEAERKIDNPAVTAYANLCRAILALQDKIEGGAGRNNLELSMDVVRHLSGFVRETYPQHAAAFLEILEPFGDRLVEIYG